MLENWNQEGKNMDITNILYLPFYRGLTNCLPSDPRIASRDFFLKKVTRIASRKKSSRKSSDPLVLESPTIGIINRYYISK